MFELWVQNTIKTFTLFEFYKFLKIMSWIASLTMRIVSNFGREHWILIQQFGSCQGSNQAINSLWALRKFVWKYMLIWKIRLFCFTFRWIVGERKKENGFHWDPVIEFQQNDVEKGHSQMRLMLTLFCFHSDRQHGWIHDGKINWLFLKQRSRVRQEEFPRTIYYSFFFFLN